MEKSGRLGGNGNWKKLSNWMEAQDLANEGGIVIGGLRADPKIGRSYGHLEAVVPMPPGMKLSEFKEGPISGEGPIVRDGNEHLYITNKGEENEKHHVGASTWGAVRASKTMDKTALKDVGWYLWVPSKPE